MNSLTNRFILNNAIGIPCIGFGTWQMPEGKETLSSVLEAFKAGYRHIDTAAAYDNEKSVGEAIKQSGLDRSDIFITSKLWNTNRGFDKTLMAFDESMKKLNLDYLDLYLIHWPANKGNWQEINNDTWRAFEKLYKEGRIKSIGVSNFLKHHLEPLLANAEIVPAVDQIEFHPGFRQMETVEYCQNNEIQIEAWSPLGSGKVLSNETLKTIAAKYSKSVAQLCIKWCLQQDVLPLPKSVTPERIVSNADVFDFEINKEDMQTINDLPYIGGSGLNPDKVNF